MKSLILFCLLTMTLSASDECKWDIPSGYGPKPGWYPPRKRIWVDLKPMNLAEDQVDDVMEQVRAPTPPTPLSNKAWAEAALEQARQMFPSGEPVTLFPTRPK